MADTKTSALTALTGASVASGDLFPIDDVSAVTLKSITAAELVIALNALGLASDSEVAAGYQPLDGDLTSIAALTTTAYGRSLLALADAAALRASAVIPEVLIVAVGDETTAITTGTAKVTFRMPFAMTLTAVRASLTTVSSSGIPTVDINEGGTTILSTKLTIDASEKTSTTAATAAVISDSSLADDAEITIDIDVAGTGAAGLKVYMIGNRT